jgi:hypothetical protein
VRTGIAENAFAGAVHFVKAQGQRWVTNFENTSVVEMDGLDTKAHHAVFKNVIKRLED